MDRHSTLGEFLRSRRARLRPEDVGLRPLVNRRRVPGLRREEIAQLAGVSVDYYVRLALLRATARPGWPRVKACRGDDCRWVFIDGSRNTSRRWCDMANWGNRAKMATFRSRHRSGAGRATVEP